MRKFNGYDMEIGNFINIQLKTLGVIPYDKALQKGHKNLLYVLMEMVKADDYIDVKLSDCIQKVADEFENTYNSVYISIYRVLQNPERNGKILPEVLFKYMKEQIFNNFEDKFDKETVGEVRVLMACGLYE